LAPPRGEKRFKIAKVSEKKKTQKKAASPASANQDPLLMSIVESSPRKGDLRKAEIIKAAIDCIAEQGIENITFESIGKKLGMLRAHVAYHFKSKQEIIDRAIEYAIATGQNTTVEEIKKAKTPQEVLAAYVQAPFDWAVRYPKQADLLLLNLYYAQKNTTYKEAELLRRKVAAERLKAILGNLPETKNHPFAAELPSVIVGIILGIFMECLLQKNLDQKTVAEYKARVLKSVLKILER
jgi:AcrR family transcriptional regulator